MQQRSPRFSVTCSPKARPPNDPTSKFPARNDLHRRLRGRGVLYVARVRQTVHRWHGAAAYRDIPLRNTVPHWIYHCSHCEPWQGAILPTVWMHHGKEPEQVETGNERQEVEVTKQQKHHH